MAALRIALVVDDHLDLGQLLCYQLEGIAEARLHTGNFEQLLWPEPWENIDIALLDYMLPGVSGGDIARYLRAAHPGIRIVFLTAKELDEETRELADRVLRKPTPLEKIVEAVTDVAGR